MLWRRRPDIFSTTVLAQSCQCLSRFIDYKLYHQCISKGGVVVVNGDRGSSNIERSGCDFYLDKSKSQYLLTSTSVLDAIVKRSNIKANDTVLEISPGTGNLTLRLLEAAENVVAVEIDLRMAGALVKRVADRELEDCLTLICEDALKTEFPKFDLVAANIPYNISSSLIAKLLFGTWPFRTATLLLEKQFARRLLAHPGDSEYNRLAANVKLVADVEHIMDVSKRHFYPVPKVDSSVVIIRLKVDIPSVDLSEWCAFTRTCFSKNNMTLGATFKQKKRLIEMLRLSELMGSRDNTSAFQDGFTVIADNEIVNDADPSRLLYSAMGMPMFKEKVVEILKSSGVEDKRPSKLSDEGLLHLLSLFNQNNIFFHAKGGKGSLAIVG